MAWRNSSDFSDYEYTNGGENKTQISRAFRKRSRSEMTRGLDRVYLRPDVGTPFNNISHFLNIEAFRMTRIVPTGCDMNSRSENRHMLSVPKNQALCKGLQTVVQNMAKNFEKENLDPLKIESHISQLTGISVSAVRNCLFKG